MGATNIEYRLPVKNFPTMESVNRWYNKEKESCRAESGNDPYNGTISTTNGISFAPHKKFNTAEETYEFILNNTAKRGRVMAIRFKDEWIIGGWAAT